MQETATCLICTAMRQTCYCYYDSDTCSICALAICDATARRQMRSYSRTCAVLAPAWSWDGSLAGSVGRMASCASCALFALLLVRVQGLGFTV